jgi:hypothetical protein
VRDALKALVAAGLGKYFRNSSWSEVEKTAVWFVQKKQADGRYRDDDGADFSKVPTYDLTQHEETQE